MSFRGPAILVWGALIVSANARAEFVTGKMLPGISLPAADGSRVEASVVAGALIVKTASAEGKPMAIVIHLLQPDCLQCRAQLKELQALDDRFKPRGVAVIGISHRGDLSELQQLAKDLALKFPMLHGTGSEIASQFAAGDSLGIADKSGIVRYAQAGFGKGDEQLWIAALEELLGGNPVSKETTSRDRLAVGDRFPAVDLASIQTGQPMALVGRDGKLTFRDEQGKETHPKAALGFFSRY